MKEYGFRPNRRTFSWKEFGKRLLQAPRAVKITLGTLVVLFGPFLLLYLAIWAGFLGPLPDTQALRNIQNSTASEVYAADGKLLGKYYIENRTQTRFEDIPISLQNALVATEDIRFYQHSGLDAYSLMRVLVKSILLQKEQAGGGSTLSQQLAKNLYPRQSYAMLSLLVNKMRETIIAKRLERIYDKSQILTLYLNTVSFGENVFGIQAASQRFFSKNPQELSIEEAATLVGMLKATTTYNPRLYPDKSQTRRNVVLNQLKKYQLLSTSQVDSLKTLPLTLNYNVRTHNTGIAPYFREHLRQELRTWAKNAKKLDGSAYNLYRDGLKIHTTLDSRMQVYAEDAMRAHMQRLQKKFDRYRPKLRKGKLPEALYKELQRTKRYRSLKKKGLKEAEILENFRQPYPMRYFSWKGEQEGMMSPLDSLAYYHYFLHAGFLAMEPQTGYVMAWVGGIDHRYFQYDHVKANRQVGSTFKPLVYATALEKGASPCDYISNEKVSFEQYENWTPHNSDQEFGGEYSMEGGMTYSVNVVAVNLMMQTGIKEVVSTAKKLGIRGNLPAVPSLALGTADLSLLDMVSAYGSMTNGGFAIEPTYILKITDARGQVLYQAPQKDNPQRVLSPRTAEMVTHMLQSVVNRGTAYSLRSRHGLKNDIAGKTGTTQSQADGWFIGATPYLVAGAWVGAENPSVHFPTLSQGQGSRTALPIWGNFMQSLNKKKAFRPITQAKFAPLSASARSEMDCDQFQFLLGMSQFKKWWESQQQQSQAPIFQQDWTPAPPPQQNQRQRPSVIPDRLRRNN